MRIGPWLATFRPLHEQARHQRLAGPRLEAYLQLRDELTQSILAPLGRNHRPGQPLRKRIRVAQAVQVEIELVGGKQRMLTSSLSSGGFGGLLHQDPGTWPLDVSLRLPRNATPVVGRAKAVGSQLRIGNHLVSFAFVDLAPEARERIEVAVFDNVLSQIEGSP